MSGIASIVVVKTVHLTRCERKTIIIIIVSRYI